MVEALYEVRCFQLEEELIDTPIGKNWPHLYPEPGFIGELEARIKDLNPAVPLAYRHQLYLLSQEIKSKISENFCEREEDFGWFLSFEHAERYVIHGANDWDECGYYNIARIAKYRPGLTYCQIPTETWWYKILPEQTRGYDQPNLVVEKINPPLRFKSYYWYGRNNDTA